MPAEPLKVAKVVLTNGAGFDVLTRMSHIAIEEEICVRDNSPWVQLEALDVHDDKVTFIARREMIAGCIVIKQSAVRAIQPPNQGGRILQ